MRILATITMIILISVIAGCATITRTRTSPPSEWEKGPEDPGDGLIGPSVVTPETEGAFITEKTLTLGSDRTGNNGDPRNSATIPAFTCTGEDDYCEVTFWANINFKDREQLRVKVSSGPDKNATGYFNENPGGASWEYRLALKNACGDDVTVSFDWAKPGDNQASIESKAYIWKVEYVCAKTDQTNKGVRGKLFDADGNELNK